MVDTLLVEVVGCLALQYMGAVAVSTSVGVESANSYL